jgi:hypothetical protein
MRNRLTIGAAALLLASATLAWAQDKPQQTAAGSSGEITIGGRFTSASGDEARYERYQDLRNGAPVSVLYNRETDNWAFNLKASNIGYRDQNYQANFTSRRVRVSMLFDSTPLNYMYGARTPYTCNDGKCTLDDNQQQLIAAARGPNTTPINVPTVGGINVIGVPQNLAQLTPGGTSWNAFATPFDMQSRRDTFGINAAISATDHVNVLLGVNGFSRSGQMPWGAAFAFPNAVELPLDVDNSATDINAAVEWASHQGMMRMGYVYSKFSQSIPTLEWDNPLQLNDWSGTPGTGYDPSGYSASARGAGFGRMAMAPTNVQNTFDWLGMIKLPGRTTANASFVLSAANQDEALIPHTSNAFILSPTVVAANPQLAGLQRETAQMRVNWATGTFNVNSRPIRDVALTARYRYNSRSDFTRSFPGNYVRFDAAVEPVGPQTHPFESNRNKLDLDATFTPIPYSAIRVGYTMDRLDHTVRATQGWQDDTFRVSFDTVGNQWVTLRAQFENSGRDYFHIDEEEILSIGHQPALRFYDEAARDRNRGSLIVELTPLSMVGVNFTLSAGRDDYAGADPTQEFGLLNNNNTAYSIGINVTPNEKLNLGADYGRETYDSLAESRNANPAPDAQWTDPNRNWTMNNDETVNFFSVYANVVKAVERTDIRFGYDYSDSDQAFVHGGPRIGGLTTAGQFIALPNVTNTWHRATFDLNYALSAKVGLGFGYYYEKFDVSDWATINTAGSDSLPVASLGTQDDTPRIDYLGGLFTGYGNRPYKGQTGVVRLSYLF